MLQFEGAALITELIATIALIVALIGLRVRRTTPWLICAAAAALVLLSTVVMIADAGTV